MLGHTETDFETAIEHGLTSQGGYTMPSRKSFRNSITSFWNGRSSRPTMSIPSPTSGMSANAITPQRIIAR
jgi:hypothetical protein